VTSCSSVSRARRSPLVVHGHEAWTACSFPAVRFASGAEFESEDILTHATAGNILGRGTTADGKRDNYAVFTEFALPITGNSKASCYDHYSDFGSATTPKLPVQRNALLSALSGGLRALTLLEISLRCHLFTR
jgi:hypothetical protein